MVALAVACGEAQPPAKSVNDVGTVPNPPTCSARDVGFSVLLDGKSVWVFGDTLFSEPANDGFQWRSSTWSTTDPKAWASAAGGPFEHVLAADGKPVQLLPHTEEEAAFNIANKDAPRRKTPWPQAIVSDGDRAVIFYINMETGPDGMWDFKSRSGSVAIWESPESPAVRTEPPIFTGDEPDWGAAAVLVGTDLYAYACEGGISKPCKIARVPFSSVTDRSAYRFFDGKTWSKEWRDAVSIFDGAPLFSVHKSDHHDAFVAIYMAPGGSEMRVRTAPAPEGPWSDARAFGEGMAAGDDMFDYALIAHPELAREGGAVDVVSYTRPTGPLRQETRLVEVRWR
ncbi:MAG: DUF4185 domain-containing protein [Polyangiaceae bacterium]|nr:DUF4185 domain-containing protein [Polyangiaceae bacterium]